MNKFLLTAISLFLLSDAYAQCPTLESYNQGNGGSTNCAGVSGTAINTDFTGTTYATVPSGSKTGNFTTRWNPGPPTVTPAIAGFYENNVKLAQNAGPASVLTNTGAGYTGKYCFYGTGNLPTNTTISVLYVHPTTSVLLYTCNYSIANNGSSVSIAGPSITSQPASKVGCLGYPTTFSVTASPGTGTNTLTYQWQKNDVDINGATSTSYTISSVTASDTGTAVYSVLVKESNGTLVSSGKVSLTLNKGAIWQGGSSSWTTLSNWSTGALPDSTTHVYIPNGVSNAPQLTSGTAKCKCLTIDGGTLTVNGGIIEIAGKINKFNSGVFDATNGTVVLNGTGLAQAVPTSTFTSNTIKNLTVNNTLGVTLQGTLNVTGTLTPTAGTLITGDYLTLKSNAAGTARIAVGSTSNYISGNVTVERYIPANTYRAWRLLAPVTIGAQTIQSAWQEGATSVSSNPNPGYGTIITCNNNYATTAGFDAIQPSMSIQAYNVTNQNWTSSPVTNTNVKRLDSEPGYMLYIRGDRTVTPSSSITGTTPTTLRSTGAVRMGDQSALTIAANKYVMVGNPYPSAIDFSLISASDRSNIGNKFWLWDPKVAGSYNLGGWVLFDAGTVTPWSPSVATGSYSTASSIIPLGMAFFVQGSASTGSLTLRESHKASSTSNSGFKTTGNLGTEQLHIALTVYKNDTTLSTADGAYVLFNDQYADTIDADDAGKPNNSGENLAIRSNDKNVALDARPAVQTGDTVHLNIWKMKQLKYKLTVTPAAFDTVTKKTAAVLVDKYLNKDTVLDLQVATSYDFIVNSDSASFASDRFTIAFKVDTVQVNDTTLSVAERAESKGTIVIYPNPTDGDNINIEMKGIEAGLYRFQLVNQVGQVVAIEELKHGGGGSTIRAFVNRNFSQGMYYISISKDGQPLEAVRVIIK